LAPLAVKVVLLPLQNAAEGGLTVTVGVVLIVTVAVAVTAAHPPEGGVVYVIV